MVGSCRYDSASPMSGSFHVPEGSDKSVPTSRIVNDDNRPLAVQTVEGGHDLPGTLEIHHSVCWVCWRFDIKRRNRPLPARRLDPFFNCPVAALA
jgi:hypothetical protein